MTLDYLVKLSVAAVLPALAAMVIYVIGKYTKAKDMSYAAKQICVGIIFGFFAILGTEFGIPINGAQLNCRDASVLIGGLMFGGPAGIIAGLIGGVERWIAVAWGVGTYTRIACSISTVIAGVIAALVRKFMFDNKKPTWGVSLSIGLAVEVFHLTMIFITNVSDAVNAIKVVKAITLPMVIANGLSVMLAAILISAVLHEDRTPLFKKRSDTPVFQTIQSGILAVVFTAILLCSLFIYQLEDNMAYADIRSAMKTTIGEVSSDLQLRISNTMIERCQLINKVVETGKYNLYDLAARFGVNEIYLINKEGIIENGTLKKNVGYDMADGEQSAEFLCLLDGVTQFVQDFGPMSSDPDVERKFAGIATSYGFLQISLDAEGLSELVSNQIDDLAMNRHISAKGYVAIMDNSGQLVSASSDFPYMDLQLDSLLSAAETGAGHMFEYSLHGVGYYCRYEIAESYYIFTLYPVSESKLQRDLTIYLTIYLLVLVFVAIYVVLYMIIKKLVVNQIVKIAQSLSDISQGNLNEVINVRSNREFNSLSDDINRTVDTLKRYIREAAARIDEELEMATRIQESVLPTVTGALARRKEFEIFAKMDPAKEVGGDFYDFYLTGENELNIMIADVSGKGIPAAMFMMRSKSILRELSETGAAVSSILSSGNNILCDGNDTGMFVTVWQCRLHLDTGLLEFCSAGHNPPVHGHQGVFDYVRQKSGLVMAGIEDVRYKEAILKLEPGDILLLYTDGVVEATDADDNLYGEERLLKVLNSCQFDTMEELLTVVRADVDTFVGDAPQFDDLTMVAVRFNGPEGKYV